MAQALRYFPLFSDTLDEEIEGVAKLFHRVDYEAGERLYAEGQNADRMYFLYTGKLVLTTVDEFGLVMELTRVTDMGALLGDEVLFQGKKKRDCTVTALEPTVLFSVKKGDFNRFGHHIPELAKNLKTSAQQREKVNEIAEKYGVFRSISKKRQHQLSTICQIRRFKPGTKIVEKDVPPAKNSYFYIVAGGKAHVIVDGETVRVLEEGDYFGEVGLVSARPPTATVVVPNDEDCFCLLVDRDDFKALFVAEPSVLAEFSIRFLGHEVSLNDVLHHRLARESFLRHCEKEFAAENVEFWKAVEDFEALQKRRERKSIIRALNVSVTSVKKKKKEILRKRATEIIERWIIEGATEEVSMEGTFRAHVLERYKNGDFSYDMFKDGKELVFNIMEGDNFKRYKESQEFAKLLQDLGQYS